MPLIASLILNGTQAGRTPAINLVVSFHNFIKGFFPKKRGMSTVWGMGQLS